MNTVGNIRRSATIFKLTNLDSDLKHRPRRPDCLCRLNYLSCCPNLPNYCLDYPYSLHLLLPVLSFFGSKLIAHLPTLLRHINFLSQFCSWAITGHGRNYTNTLTTKAMTSIMTAIIEAAPPPKKYIYYITYDSSSNLAIFIPARVMKLYKIRKRRVFVLMIIFNNHL